MSVSDLTVERFCPRCNTVTVWDTPGTATLECTNFRDGEYDHCGFTLAAVLTPVEEERLRAYERWINPPAPSLGYLWV